jgi:hypothetical protein
MGMSAGTSQGGSDLGRRIQEARSRAGLSRAETSVRAGMAASYLAYLETSPAPDVTKAALTRLAAVLGTTPEALAGAGLGLPPGQRLPGNRPVLQHLSAAQSREHLAAGGIGRFLFVDDRGPVAVPVNYKMLAGDIVFRTGADTSLAAGAEQGTVSFEVDHLDEALGEGWSVLVSGEAHVVTEPAELQQVRALGITPWAGGDREIYVRIAARDMSGRQIRVSG